MKSPKTIVAVWCFTSASAAGKVYQTLLYCDGSASCDCPGWTYKGRITAAGKRTCKHTRLVYAGQADAAAVSRTNYTDGAGQACPLPFRPQVRASKNTITAPAPLSTRRAFDFSP